MILVNLLASLHPRS